MHTPPTDTSGFNARYARLVADHVRALNLDHRPVLAALGLPEDDATVDLDQRWVAAEALTQALHIAARLSQDPHIGLTVGQQVRPAHMGPLGYALTSCADAKVGMSLFDRLQSLVCTKVRIEHRIKGEWVETAWLPQGDLPADTHLWTLILVSRVAFGRWVLGRQLSATQIWLPCPPPQDPGPLLAYVGAPIAFNAPMGSERFPAAWLQLANPNADAGLHQLMNAVTRQQWARQGQAPEQLLALLRQGIRQHIRQGALPLLDKLSLDLEESLGLSSRQVQRRLAEQGLSFKDLVEEVRREQVLHELRHTPLSMAEVAQRAAYAEVSSMHRAVRRWTGQTPLAVRQGAPSGAINEP